MEHEVNVGSRELRRTLILKKCKKNLQDKELREQ